MAQAPAHGTIYRHQLGCHCKKCAVAHKSSKAEHGTARWRAGCRCTLCRSAKASADRDYRRTKSLEALSSYLLPIFDSVSSGASLSESMPQHLHEQALWGVASWNAEVKEALDRALMDGRRPVVPHGSSSGYRHYSCRCPECRAAKNARKY